MTRSRPTFHTIERTPRSELVREQLEAAIARGDFRPGDSLPSERELVDVFGVSRVSVREAIRSLEAVGLVEVFQGRGCFVAKGPTDGYFGPFARWLEIHKDEVVDLLKVRGALDELAAESAAQRADARSLARVRKAEEAFSRAIEDSGTRLDRIVELDIEFHLAIAEASGSKLMTHLLDDLNSHLHESRRIALSPDGRPKESAKEHSLIVRALVDGKPADARAAAARHVDAVRVAVAGAAAGKRRRSGERKGGARKGRSHDY
ncbi:MAG: GntR family transcriptional regulator [Actinomycetota bacterium]|nr:GntR family transcriptional regulator [Actinomycetota bacterium]